MKLFLKTSGTDRYMGFPPQCLFVFSINLKPVKSVFICSLRVGLAQAQPNDVCTNFMCLRLVHMSNILTLLIV